MEEEKEEDYKATRLAVMSANHFLTCSLMHLKVKRILVERSHAVFFSPTNRTNYCVYVCVCKFQNKEVLRSRTVGAAIYCEMQ